MSSKDQLNVLVLCCAVFLLLTPLSSFADEPDQIAGTPIAPEEALAARAKLYWSYKVAGDLESAYRLEDPRVREKLKLQDYLLNFGTDVKWLEAQVGAVDLSRDPATVEVTLRYAVLISRHNPKDGRRSTVQDKWVQVNGQWYHYIHTKTRDSKPQRPVKSTPNAKEAAPASPQESGSSIAPTSVPAAAPKAE